MRKIIRMIGLLTGAAILLIVLGFFANRFLNTETQKKHTIEGRLCQPHTPHTNHLIVIENDAFTPASTVGRLCDSITVINKDSKSRYMAFGEHEHHIVYDNYDVQILEKTQSFTFTLNDLGTYEIHDHLEDKVQGTFTVVQN